MKNKIMWKDVTLIVLAILLIFSMCRIHTLKQSNKKLYSQNLELNHQLATLKEKNTGLESKLNSEESITDEKKSDNSQHLKLRRSFQILDSSPRFYLSNHLINRSLLLPASSSPVSSAQDYHLHLLRRAAYLLKALRRVLQVSGSQEP